MSGTVFEAREYCGYRKATSKLDDLEQLSRQLGTESAGDDENGLPVPR